MDITDPKRKEPRHAASKRFFQNDQWRVDARGMECIDGVNRSRILPEELRTMDADRDPHIVNYLFRRTWVDRLAFLEAYNHALSLHPDVKSSDFPEDWLDGVLWKYRDDASLDPLRSWDDDDDLWS